MRTKLTTSSLTRSCRLILVIAPLTLSGCSQVYDDTKGWGNDVEAWFRKDVLGPIGAEIRGEPYPPRETTPAVAQAADKPAMQKAETESMAKESMAKDQMAKDTRIASASDSLPAGSAAPSEAPAPSQANNGALGTKVYPQTAGKAAEKSPMEKPAMEKPAMAAKDKAAAIMAKPASAAMSLHLSSNKTKDSAMREWAQLKTAFPEQLGSLEPEIMRTDLGKKGIFYRVMAGPFQDKPSAAQVCSELKKKKQYCAVMPAPTAKG